MKRYVMLMRRRTRESVDSTQITEYDMDSDDCRFVEKCDLELRCACVTCDMLQVQHSL